MGMTPENADYSQVSFFGEKEVPVELPGKKFYSVGGKRLAYTMTQDYPPAWIIEEGSLFSQPKKEMPPQQSLGISIHEAAYLTLLMNLHPLAPESNPFPHAQEIATNYLPLMFPTANKKAMTRREMLLTQYLPDFWPRQNQSLDRETLKTIFRTVHQKTLFPHSSSQNRLDDFEFQDYSTIFQGLVNFVDFSQKEPFLKPKENNRLLFELAIIQNFRKDWHGEELNIRVTSFADILVIPVINQSDGIPFSLEYHLFDIKSGHKPNSNTKVYLQHLYQLWIMKRGLERAGIHDIENAIGRRSALIVNSTDSPLEALKIHCYLVWPSLDPDSRYFCESVTLPDNEKTEEKFYRALVLYRQFKDGKLEKDSSSG